MPTKPASGTDTKLDEIIDIVNVIKTDLAVFTKRMTDVECTSKENKESIKGNGKQGLESRTNMIERNLALINWMGAAMMLAVIADIMTRILAK